MDWGRVGQRLLRTAVRQAPRVIARVQRSQAARSAGAGRPGPPAGAASGDAAGRHADRRRASASTPETAAPGRGRPTRQRPTGQLARHLSYEPDLDGGADPGEVVWTWVAYEEDPTRGKDRPVLVVGRDGADVLALMLSSKGHDGERGWLALGPGAWDREHRPSWLRLDRVVEVEQADVRREGSILARDRFDVVAQRLRDEHGWR